MVETASEAMSRGDVTRARERDTFIWVVRDVDWESSEFLFVNADNPCLWHCCGGGLNNKQIGLWSVSFLTEQCYLGRAFWPQYLYIYLPGWSDSSEKGSIFTIGLKILWVFCHFSFSMTLAIGENYYRCPWNVGLINELKDSHVLVQHYHYFKNLEEWLLLITEGRGVVGRIACFSEYKLSLS